MSYEKKEVIEAVLARGKLSNPKTDDSISRYVIYGTIAATMIIAMISIRKRFIMKRKKTQF